MKNFIQKFILGAILATSISTLSITSSYAMVSPEDIIQIPDENASEYSRQPSMKKAKAFAPPTETQHPAINQTELDRNLLRAIENGNAQLLKICIAQGADINKPGKEGKAPLHFAACFGREEIVRILLAKNANKQQRDVFGWTPLEIATVFGKDQAIITMLY